VTPPGPAYRDLPAVDGIRHTWGLWGTGDRFGALNRITTDSSRRGLAAGTGGRAFSLNLDMEQPAPPLFERPVMIHEIRASPNGSLNDVISDWNTQNSSQWDGFLHVSWPGRGHYNGLPAAEHGVQHWAGRPIVTRAVVADVGRFLAERGRPLDHGARVPVEVADLAGTLAAQGTRAEPGDILLVRTGWLEWYRQQPAAEQRRLSLRAELRTPGLSPAEEMAGYLWDLGIAAVAADNPGLEAWPPPDAVDPAPGAAVEHRLHVRLLPSLGMPIGELWDLDELAADCAADGRYAACLTSAPISLRGGAATPANAIAIK
jgi:kynurenine formamidase